MIYKKPTSTDHAINDYLNHPYLYKMANLNCAIHIVFEMPVSTEEFENKINIIKYVAVVNGYKSNIVNMLFERKQNKHYHNIHKDDIRM